HMHESGPDDRAISESHRGPVLAYMALADTNGVGDVWFKIFEDGYDSSSNVWGVDTLIKNNGKVDLVIPADIAPGKYLVRTEIIALHEGNRVYGADKDAGAQFYPSCAMITVMGAGTAKPKIVVSAADYFIPVNNDVGLVYTNMHCGTTPCSQTNLYGQPTYTAFLGNRDYRRILMSFSLANHNIDACTLQFPQTANGMTVSVSRVLSKYNAKTVTPATAPITGGIIAQATNTKKINITRACQAAINGVVRIIVDARGGPFTIPSGASMLMINA
ncbi:hypothetical protein GGH96_000708, partial [Coemansia sp. RSA 1972]